MTGHTCGGYPLVGLPLGMGRHCTFGMEGGSAIFVFLVRFFTFEQGRRNLIREEWVN